MERRAVLKGAAWAAPVILAAVAAPQTAASVPPVEACPLKTYYFKADPNDPNDRANITVITGVAIIVNFVKDYPNATGIKNHSKEFWKSSDSGVKAGQEVVIDLKVEGICDPDWLQVDGNNTHYYGKGLFHA